MKKEKLNIDKILEGIYELRQSHKEISDQQKKTDEQLQRTDEQLQRTDEQLQRTDEQLKKTSEKLRRTSEILGNMGDTNGQIAEEYFFTSLQSSLKLGEIQFNQILKNVKPFGESGPEFDIILLNGDSVALIEVKRKAYPEKLHSLILKQVEGFKKYFSDYSNHKLYFGVALMITNSDLIDEAKEEGIFLLTQKGQNVELVNSDVKTF